MALQFASECVSMTSCLKVLVLETGLPYLEIPNGILVIKTRNSCFGAEKTVGSRVKTHGSINHIIIFC